MGLDLRGMVERVGFRFPGHGLCIAGMVVWFRGLARGMGVGIEYGCVDCCQVGSDWCVGFAVCG